MPAGKVLLRQIGATGDQAFFDVVISDDLEQFVELGHAQALADVRLQEALTRDGRKGIGALEFDLLDEKTTAVGRGRGRCRGGRLAG
ncbi:hypothetical protein D3C79_1002920 [compost metagenome]